MSGKRAGIPLFAAIIAGLLVSCTLNVADSAPSPRNMAKIRIQTSLATAGIHDNEIDSIRFIFFSPEPHPFFLIRSFDYRGRSATIESVPCIGSLELRTELVDSSGFVLIHATFGLGSDGCEDRIVTLPDTIFTPLTPAALQAVSISEEAIRLSWTNRWSGHSATIIERATEAGAFSPRDTSTDTTYLDTGLEPLTRYRYRLSAINRNGRSGFIESQSQQTPGPDRIPPSLAVHSHHSNDTVSHRSVVLYGTAWDASSLRSVTVNGAQARRTGEFWISDEIVIAADSLVFTITATDSSPSANSTTQELTLHFRPEYTSTDDTIPPVIRVLSHRNADTVGTRAVKLYGIVHDQAGIASFTINADPTTVDNTYWEYAAVLDDSTTTFTLRAVDSSSHANETTASVTLRFLEDFVPVTNRPPFFTVNAANLSAEIAAGQEYSRVLSGADPDSFNVLSFSVDTPLTLIDDSVVVWVPTLDHVGTHRMRALVRDQDGAHDSLFWTIKVIDPSINRPPVFLTRSRDLLDSIPIGATYRDSLQAQDPDQENGLLFSKKGGPAQLQISGTGLLVWRPTAADAGVHPCTAKVSDSLGAHALLAWTITVYDSSLPSVSAGKDTTVSIGDQVHLRGTASRSGATIASYAWDIGASGVYTATSGPETTFTASTTPNEAFPCVLRVTDSFGKSATDTVTIRIVLDPPVAKAGRDTSVQVSERFVLRGSATDQFGYITRYEWDIGGSGTFVESPDGSYEGVAPDTIGTLMCILRVTDNDGITAEDTVKVTVVRLTMVLINPGPDPGSPDGRYLAFIMGSADGHENEQPPHTVYLSPFWVDSVEVRQSEYFELMRINPSGTVGDNLPVSAVTWFDAVLFCNARSRRDGFEEVYSYSSVTGTPGSGATNLVNLHIDYSRRGYRLPTEAEWEFACRGGSTTRFFWGNDSSQAGVYAWYDANSTSRPRIVGTKQHNLFNLFDMTGNLIEWCNDWYSASYYATEEGGEGALNPKGPATPTGTRVLRGGSWNSGSGELGSAHREFNRPDFTSSTVGFRCVLPAQ